jgi:hypothetical protein
MATYRPLSRRDDPAFDGPVEGLPGYMVESAVEWIEPLVAYGKKLMPSVFRDLETALRMEPPLVWSNGVYSAWSNLRKRIADDGEFGLNVLDYFVSERCTDERRAELDALLVRGGSAWRVAEVPGDGHRLERRAPGPVAESMDAIETDNERAHRHLRVAWGELMGRDPNPSTAYREAVRAVEAAAKPVLLPDNPTATLGTMIVALRDKPDKWRVGLEHGEPMQVREMCQLLWKGQIDRHGSDDPDAPLNVSQEEADSAFYLALALVRLFTSGAVARQK